MEGRRHRERAAPRRRRALPTLIGGALAVVAIAVAIVVLERGKPEESHREPEATPTADREAPPPRQVPPGAERWGSFVVWPGAHSYERRSVELPVATQALDEVEEEDFIEIVVTRSDMYCGRELQDLASLRDLLIPKAALRIDPDDPLKPSLQAVLVTADARVRWRDVQWVLMACADPQVRIYRVYWAARRRRGDPGAAVLPAHLQRSPDPDPVEAAVVELERGRDELQTRLKLGRKTLGIDDAGFDQLLGRMEGLVAERPDLSVELYASASVPFAQVVRAVDVLRGAGVERILFSR